MTRKLAILILPLLLCLTGCTSKEEVRETAIQQFDICQTAVEEALRPYLFVLQDDTNPEDNYEGSDYYVRYLSVSVDSNTEISIILENPLNRLRDTESRVSVSLSHSYSGEKDTLPTSQTELFASVVQATGNTAVTEDLCRNVLEDAQTKENSSDGSYREGEYTSEKDGIYLYYYDDGELSWSLTYEGTLPPLENSSEENSG